MSNNLAESLQRRVGRASIHSSGEDLVAFICRSKAWKKRVTEGSSTRWPGKRRVSGLIVGEAQGYILDPAKKGTAARAAAAAAARMGVGLCWRGSSIESILGLAGVGGPGLSALGGRRGVVRGQGRTGAPTPAYAVKSRLAVSGTLTSRRGARASPAGAESRRALTALDTAASTTSSSEGFVGSGSALWTGGCAGLGALLGCVG